MLHIFLTILFLGTNFLYANTEENLELDVIPYEQLAQGDEHALQTLRNALHKKGIVGVRGVPGYKEKYARFIAASREFNALPEEIKEQYKPDFSRGDKFLGYQMGKEKFRMPNGESVIDDLKASYYAFIPDTLENKWPYEVELRTPFEELGELMAHMSEFIMRKIELGYTIRYPFEEGFKVGRMLYYRKSESNANPYWCGAHFDHCLFTAVLPAVYFVDGEQIPEPEEAGLFVRTAQELPFKKVVADDLDVMMFQVGEFGQLVSDDSIRATEHCVRKALGSVERYTLAVFYNAPMDIPVYSQSVLAEDERYGANKGEMSTFRQWERATFRRNLVKQDS